MFATRAHVFPGQAFLLGRGPSAASCGEASVAPWTAKLLLTAEGTEDSLHRLTVFKRCPSVPFRIVPGNTCRRALPWLFLAASCFALYNRHCSSRTLGFAICAS